MTWLQELSERRGKIKKLLNAGFLGDPTGYTSKIGDGKFRPGEEVFSGRRKNKTAAAASRRSVDANGNGLN